ncbi:MAG TPA: aminopeptidase P N-terminal domain-containing protein [Burkholderiales bacterium]
MKTFNPKPYAARRARLIKQLKDAGGGIAIIPTAPEAPRNRDTHYPYRHDSYAYYLSGFTEPETVIVLIAGKKSATSILFCRAKHEEREIWDGFRYGPQAAKSTFAFDEAYPVEEFDARLPNLLAGAPSLFYSMGFDAAFDDRVMKALNAVRAMARSGLNAPEAIRDARTMVDAMRLVKDKHEIDTMRRAGAISTEAHKRAMRAARPGAFEYEVEAELLHEFRRQGSEYPAYTSIVAAGASACVLHYISNDQQMKDGDLLLIDAGCELNSYASDITRTFPVNGKFSGPQRDLYQIVLDAQAAAIAKTKPGVPFNVPHEAAVKVLAQGMVDVGLLRGSVEAAIEQGNKREGGYFRFYMHRTGHWLGMDVHDCGSYVEPTEVGEVSERKDPLSNEVIKNRPSRILHPGMVLTIEPGIYVRPAEGVPEAFHNIGIRIEDDAIVTDAGCELISRGVPVAADEIEALMRA